MAPARSLSFSAYCKNSSNHARWGKEVSVLLAFFGGEYPTGARGERWGAGVETQKNVRGEIGGWGRVPFNETYAPSLSTIYDGA